MEPAQEARAVLFVMLGGIITVLAIFLVIVLEYGDSTAHRGENQPPPHPEPASAATQ